MARGIPSSFVLGAEDISTLEDDDLIADHVRQILATRAGDTKERGEHPTRGDFGSRLHKLQHRRIDAFLKSEATVLVLEALRRWVPTVTTTGVEVTEPEEGILLVRVTYTINQTGSTRRVEIEVTS